MECGTSLNMTHHGRQPNPTTTQANHASRSWQRYQSRMVRETPASSPRLSLSPSRCSLARKAGSCFPGQTESNFRSRLFLARAWMQVRAGAEIKAGLLASQARGQRATRPREGISTRRSRLVRSYGLAMRNPVSRTPGPKASAVSGRANQLNERNAYHG